MQLLVALAFVSIPMVRHRYGAAAKAAAEAELRRQNVPVTVLEENNLKFDASGHETAAPAAIAAIMVALAALNLAADSWGQTLTWVFQPIVLLINVVILYSQLTAATSVRAAFKRKGDPILQRIDVPSLLKAAESAFPTWVMPVLQNIRHAVVFGGSALALAAVPADIAGVGIGTPGEPYGTHVRGGVQIHRQVERREQLRPAQRRARGQVRATGHAERGAPVGVAVLNPHLPTAVGWPAAHQKPVQGEPGELAALDLQRRGQARPGDAPVAGGLDLTW
jgi:hypothetical protein